MPYFKVLINGRGLNVPNEERNATIRGFYTTRLVRAQDSSQAKTMALAAVRETWQKHPYAQANSGTAPVLCAEEVTPSSFLESLRFKNTGHSFYASAETSDA